MPLRGQSLLVRTDTAVPSVLQPRFSVRYSWGRFDLTPQRIRPCSSLRANSSLRFQRSSPRNETTRPVRLRYETRVPCEVPCSEPFLPGPHAPTSVSVINANGTVPTERRLRLANGSSTTSGSSAFAATRGKASSKRRSNEHQTNVRRTPTKRQHDINGTSTRHQRDINATSTERQPNGNRTSTKRQQNSNVSSTRQSILVEQRAYRDSMRHALPSEIDGSGGCLFVHRSA